jgi:hypothetical protein
MNSTETKTEILLKSWHGKVVKDMVANGIFTVFLRKDEEVQFY